MEPLREGDPARIGPYRLTARLGAGAMGQVYLGEDPNGRKAAVKLLNPELADSPEYRERFAREFEAARRVAGDRTGHVVDADPEAERPWLATAYLPGPTLREAVVRDGPLDEARGAALGAGLAEGLTAIHGCGLVHRDLKPSNVILAEDGPRIIDFGIARAVDASTLTGTGTVLGTYGFMSPEQITADTAGPASDVFALGCVLAFAATGRGPFDASTVPAVIHRVISEPPRLDGVPGGLREVIEACLAKTPESRPGTGEVRDRLAALAAEAPTRVDPGPEPTRVDPNAGPGYADPGAAPGFTPGRADRSGYGPPADGTTVLAAPGPEPRPRMGRRALLIGGGAVVLGAAAVPLWTLLDRDDTPSGGSDPGTKRIGISLPYNEEPRWNFDGEQLTAHFEAAGHDVDLMYADGTRESQIAHLEGMIADEVDAVVVSLIDADAAADVLDRARAAGVLVVAYDRPVGDDPAADYYVGSDLSKVGVLQAEYLIASLGLDSGAGPFTLELFAGNALDPTARVFYDGAWDVLRPYVEAGRLIVPSGETDFDDVATDYWDPAIARDRMTELLETYYPAGSSLDVLLSPFDGITAALIDAIETHGLAMPLVVGHDPDADSLPYLTDGRQAMTVFTDPRALAEATVDLVATVLDGGEPDTDDTGAVPTVLVDPVAVDAEHSQELLIDSGYLD
ncbi:substrate-binding domain-containing protein [Glycomyces sp. NPDC047010]|uniref:substrate-binding domain-containing protein n=1 Tax=Glycomyces sp. NPDC047010 TaxID=3155023 RepID=UPI0033E42AF3